MIVKPWQKMFVIDCIEIRNNSEVRLRQSSQNIKKSNEAYFKLTNCNFAESLCTLNLTSKAMKKEWQLAVCRSRKSHIFLSFVNLVRKKVTNSIFHMTILYFILYFTPSHSLSRLQLFVCKCYSFIRHLWQIDSKARARKWNILKWNNK